MFVASLNAKMGRPLLQCCTSNSLVISQTLVIFLNMTRSTLDILIFKIKGGAMAIWSDWARTQIQQL